MKRALVFLAAWGGMAAAFAWDPIGHMVVTETAYRNLSPKAKTAVDASVAAFNRKENTPYDFVNAGCWMDDVRPTRRDLSPWHYIELPYTRDGEPLPDPSKVNVLWGMNHCVAILKGERTDPKVDRDEALIILFHLVGDVHQPHHTVSRADDRGGNKVDVPNLKDAVVEAFPNRRNLHTFTDTAYRRTLKDGLVVETIVEPPYLPSNPFTGHARARPLAVALAEELGKQWDAKTYPATGGPEDWVRESHRQGYDEIYQKLPGGEATNPVTLDQAYVDNFRALAGQKLIQAGHRLAALLNEIYR